MSKRNRIDSVVAALVLVAAAVIGVGVTQAWPRTLDLHDVARLIPADAVSVDATDWTAIREALDVADERVVAEASSRDLVTRSVLAASGDHVQNELGWSPATVRWEAWVQTPAGSALFVGLPGSTDGAEAALQRTGWSQSGDVWQISSPDGTVPSHLTRVRLLPGGVAVAAESTAVLDVVLDVAEGTRSALADDPASIDVWSSSAPLATFGLQRRDAACVSTSASVYGDDIAAQAEVAKEGVGPLARYAWLLRGLDATSERFVVAMAFDSARVAADQITVRSQLAVGPFIGQNGDVEDSIVLDRTRLAGSVAVLDFEHQTESSVALMSFIGPLVLASC